MELDSILMTWWPQIVALVTIAWLIARLSEKVAQLETKVRVAFELINKLTEETYKRK